MKAKIISIILALVVLTAAFAGCSDKDAAAGIKLYDYKLSDYVTVGEYTNIPITSQKFSYTDEDLQFQIDSTLANYPVATEITERGIENGDTANIDYTGYLEDEEFAGGADIGYDLVIGSGNFIPGFEEALIGANSGETVTIDISFPEDYSNAPDLAGKAVQFVVTINTITLNSTPEYNLDTITSIFPEFSSLEAFETALIQSMEENFTYQNENSLFEQLWSQILEGSTIIDYPETEYKALYDEEITYEQNTALETYGMEWSEYITTYHGITVEEYETNLDEAIKNYMKELLTLFSVTRSEKVEITEEEFTTSVTNIASSMGATTDELLEYYGEEYLRIQLQWEKTLTHLLEKANLTVVE